MKRRLRVLSSSALNSNYMYLLISFAGYTLLGLMLTLRGRGQSSLAQQDRFLRFMTLDRSPSVSIYIFDILQYIYIFQEIHV